MRIYHIIRLSSTEDTLYQRVVRTYQKKALCRNRPIYGAFFIPKIISVA